MAKMVQDLSQDFLYDDEENNEQNDNKKKMSPKKRNYIIGLSILGVAVVAAGVIYGVAANVWLKDYTTLSYLKYAYSVNKDGKVSEATVVSINLDSKYPSTFRIPSEVKGHKITSIADGAFAGATRLKKVIMTDNITTIGSQAFGGCTELESFTFSKNLNSIGTNAFINTKYEQNWDKNSVLKINNILINIGEDYFDGDFVLVNDKNSIVPDDYSSYKKYYFTDIDSENKIDTWMEGLFENNKKLIYLESPSYLNKIPTNSFKNCSKLKEVKFSSNLTSVGDEAFNNCSNLSKVNLNENITYYGKYAFKNTDINFDGNLTHATYLGEGVFQNVTSINKITYSSSMTSIPNYAFSGCTNLNEIVFPNPDNIITFGIGAFEETAFTEFKVPKYVNSLNDYVFSECPNLERIYLYQPSIDEINASTGEDEDDEDYDETIKKPGLNRINAYVFYSCSKFKSIKLYNKEGKIEDICADDSTIYLPSTLTTTSNANGSDKGYAFYQTAVEKIVIPSSLKSLGEHFVDGSSSLKSIVFEKNNESSYALTSIENGAFSNTTSLEEITIPFTVNKMGPAVFSNSTGFKKISFEEVPSGSKVTALSTIAESLFSGCSNLSEIELPSTISNIKKNSFNGLTSLSQLLIKGEVKTIEANAFKDNNNLSLYFFSNLATIKKNSSRYYKNWKDATTFAYIFSEEKPSEEDISSATNLGFNGFFKLDENNKPVIY